ncbi:hypothetical protein [Aeromonas sp. MdU4]
MAVLKMPTRQIARQKWTVVQHPGRVARSGSIKGEMDKEIEQ